MITFMVATLGSLIFWVIYFMITLVMSTAIMRKITPRTFKYITTGKTTSYDMGFEYVLMILVMFIFWPVVIVGCIIKSIFCLIVGPMLMGLFKTIDKITPDISINTNNGDK